MTTLDAMCDAWQLTSTEPLGPRAVRVTTVDGRAAVLKVAEPSGWRAGSVAALKAWRTHGAVEVLRAKPGVGAVLLELLEPAGLWGDDELEALALLWDALHVPAPAAVPTVGELLSPVLDRWTCGDRGHGLPPRLAQQAATTARRLLDAPGRQVLVHGQLHADHVMSRGGGVVAISPLGFAGDAECEMAAAFDLVGGGVTALQEHFWALLDALVARGNDVDEVRLRDWTVVLSAARASATDDRATRTHLLTVAKAIGALEVGHSWD